jgi:hypothetical protein
MRLRCSVRSLLIAVGYVAAITRIVHFLISFYHPFGGH